jgi:thioredoxin reductase (NADPH)
VTQARRLGAEILMPQTATRVEVQHPYRVITLADGTRLSCHALLLATGASFNILKMPGAAELTGAGVYYGAAYTEAVNYTDQDVFVAGGANSAAQGALFLCRFARKVVVLVRGAELPAAQHLAEAMRQNDRIEILVNADLVEVHGQGKLEEIVVKDNVTGELRTLKGAALFVFIGVKPQSDLVAELVRRDEKGHVLTGLDVLQDGQRPKGWPLDRDPFLLETSVPGIFAAGDVRFGTAHRVAPATGEGGVAVAMIREYLKTL